MAYWERYLLPKTIDEALSYLRSAGGAGRVIAGGTDLLLDIQQGRKPAVDTLVDISEVVELQQILEEDGHLRIGSAVTHAQIVSSELLRRHAKCLVDASALIGGTQVRNVATIGGNVANALPAADGSIALLALDAQAELASVGGRRWEPLERLFKAPGVPSFDPHKEILLGFRIEALGEGQHTTFHRIMRPQGVAIAILNMAVWIEISAGGQIENLRLAVGPTGLIPRRARQTESFLMGKLPTNEVVALATRVLLDEVHLRTSPHRATEAYRKLLLRVLMERNLLPA